MPTVSLVLTRLRQAAIILVVRVNRNRPRLKTAATLALSGRKAFSKSSPSAMTTRLEGLAAEGVKKSAPCAPHPRARSVNITSWNRAILDTFVRGCYHHSGCWPKKFQLKVQL